VVVTNYKKIIFSILILLSSVQNIFAEMMEEGRTKFKLLFNLYHQNSDDGKQVYDNSGGEEANVVEPMLFVEHQVDETTAVDAHIVFDAWTAASDTKLDANTGASGEGIGGQARISANFGARKEIGKWELSSGVGFSSEYDYKSFNGKLGAQRSFAKDNFTLALGFQIYKDEVKLFQDLTPASSAMISGFLPRDIYSYSLSATQLLTRRDIIQFGVNFVQAKKNLESTASSVLVNNVRESESLPESRDRYALSTKLVHGFNETLAMNVSYRYYGDDWDVSAHTIRTAILKEVNDDEDFLEVALRYHAQDKVKYYQDSFVSALPYMTSDSDMDKFDSFEVSTMYSSNLEDRTTLGIELEDLTWNNSVTGYKRSNGLIYGYYQTSIGFSF
tara:strand:- start:89068 stop:90231 length:1164 start_codon:yes stop_codon:yes gene_type:complete